MAAALVRKVRGGGKQRAAGVLRSYLSTAFNAAKRAPFDSALPADLIAFGIEHNPVDAIPAIAVQRGDRTLSAAERNTDEKRAALVAWEARLEAILQAERTPSNVVRLGQRAVA